MAAYNAVNGTAMTENDLLAEPLKGEWGFDGVVVSDWGALYDGEPAARAALDLTMPGPDEKWAEPLVEAVRAGRVPEAAIDAKLRRLLRLAARDRRPRRGRRRPPTKPAPGRIEDAVPAGPRGGRVGRGPAAQRRRAAAGAPTRLRRVAVLGPGARDARAARAAGPRASRRPTWSRRRRPARRARRARRGGHRRRRGCCPTRCGRRGRTSSPGRTTGCGGRRCAGSTSEGATVAEQHAGTATIIRHPRPTSPRARPSSRSTPASRRTRTATGASASIGRGDAVPWPSTARPCCEAADAGGAFDIHEMFASPPQHDDRRPAARRAAGRRPHPLPLAGRGLHLPGRPGRRARRCGPADEELAHAVELARTSDVAVVVVGTTDAVESEGFDRTSLTLPGRQDELVRAVAAVNPRTVVVVNAGAPVELPWRDEVAAVLVSWFPGMEFGNALADVLLGAVEPGGRLPTTWPAAMADAPVLDDDAHRRPARVRRGARHRAPGLPGARHGAGVLVRARPRLHDLGRTSRSRRPPTAPATGFDVTVRRAQHRRRGAASRSCRSTPRGPDSAVDAAGRAGWPASPSSRSTPGEVVDVPVAHPRRGPCGTGTSSARGWAVEAGRPRRCPSAASAGDSAPRPPSRWASRVSAAPSGLRVEHLDEALGIRTAAPRLSWRLPDGAREQRAYRITTDNGWDSGWVDSDQSLLVPYAGPAAVVVAAGRVAGAGARPTWGRARSRTPAGSRPACCGPRTGRRPGSSPGRCRTAPPGERPAALLRFEFDVDRPVVSRPAARHRAGPLRGVPQRRAGRRRRADPGLHPVRRAAAGADATTSPTRSATGRNALGVVLADGWFRGQTGITRAADQWGSRLARPRPAAPGPRRRRRSPSSAPGRAGAARSGTSSRPT